MDLNNDELEVVENELQSLIEKATENSLSAKESKRLEDIFGKHQLIFKMKFSTRGRSEVPPTKIILDGTKNSIDRGRSIPS